jgi:hypothetical protein
LNREENALVKATLPLLLLLCLFWPLSSNAERVGDFDFSAQEVSDEEGRIVGRSSNSMNREVTQNLTYKVRIDYKGLDKLKDLNIKYILSYRPNQRKPKFVKGEKKITEASPQCMIEFETISAENTYSDQVNEGLRQKIGKTRLDGIAIRIYSGKEIIGEWAKPSSVDKYWDEPSVK